MDCSRRKMSNNVQQSYLIQAPRKRTEWKYAEAKLAAFALYKPTKLNFTICMEFPIIQK